MRTVYKNPVGDQIIVTTTEAQRASLDIERIFLDEDEWVSLMKELGYDKFPLTRSILFQGVMIERGNPVPAR